MLLKTLLRIKFPQYTPLTIQRSLRGRGSLRFMYNEEEQIENSEFGQETSQSRPNNEIPLNKPPKRNIPRLIKNATTLTDIDSPPEGDPFLSSPYPKGVKLPRVEDKSKEIIIPSTKSVIIFPGQGTQHVGMCGDPATIPQHIKLLYETASSILGYDILDLCWNGPQEKLDETRYCQPAVFITSLAALERLRDVNPEAIEKCVSTAGFSVGELAALTLGGVFSFEDAVRIVKVRAEAMHYACEIVQGQMATVLYGADSKLPFAIKVAKEWCKREFDIQDPVCSIANYLFPHCKVIAGHREAIAFIQQRGEEFNLRKVKILPVAGAFHTTLMKPAVEPLRLVLDSIELNKPRMRIYSNCTGTRYHAEKDIKKHFVKQIYKPVNWEQILHHIYQRPADMEYPNTYEVGPGKGLKTVLKMVNSKAALRTESFQP